jgi:hypothetical protein
MVISGRKRPARHGVVFYAVAGYRSVTHSVLRSYRSAHQADY